MNDLFKYETGVKDKEKGEVVYSGCTFLRPIGSWGRGDNVNKIKITRRANVNEITIYDKCTFKFTSEPVEHITLN